MWWMKIEMKVMNKIIKHGKYFVDGFWVETEFDVEVLSEEDNKDWSSKFV